MTVILTDTKVPIIKPAEFDEYLFQDWKAEVSGYYDRFHIERIENYKQHLKPSQNPHRRSVFFLFFITKGSAVRYKGLTDFKISVNQVFCLPADQITALSEISDDAEGFYCHFSADVFNEANFSIDIIKDFPFFYHTAVPLVSLSNPARANILLDILKEEYVINQEERFGLIGIYLLALLNEIKLNFKMENTAKTLASDHLTQKFKNALMAYICEFKTVKEFADYLRVTPNHLNKCVKQTTGKTAHKLIEDMRVLEAKVLLKQTDLSIGEIAFKIGKSDPSDFARFFKAQTEITPNQYRKS